MKHVFILSIGLLGGLFWGSDSFATTPSTNTYGSAMVMVPSNVVSPGDAVPSLPVIIANGVMKMGGTSQVAFKVTDPTNEAAGSQSYVLKQGETRDNIKVVKIDHAAGAITFDNHGTTQKINMERSAEAVYTPAPPSTTATSPANEASLPVVTGEQGGQGISVVVVGHRDPPQHVNGLGPVDVPPGGGAGYGIQSTNAMMNTNRSVPFVQRGQFNPSVPSPTIVSPSPGSVLPPPSSGAPTGTRNVPPWQPMPSSSPPSH